MILFFWHLHSGFVGVQVRVEWGSGNPWLEPASFPKSPYILSNGALRLNQCRCPVQAGVWNLWATGRAGACQVYLNSLQVGVKEPDWTGPCPNSSRADCPNLVESWKGFLWVWRYGWNCTDLDKSVRVRVNLSRMKLSRSEWEFSRCEMGWTWVRLSEYFGRQLNLGGPRQMLRSCALGGLQLRETTLDAQLCLLWIARPPQPQSWTDCTDRVPKQRRILLQAAFGWKCCTTV